MTILIPSPKKQADLVRSDLADTSISKGVSLVDGAVPFLRLLKDGSDETATILAQAVSAGVYVIPPNAKYNKKTLLQSLPASVVLLDLSKVNDFSAAGETAKSVGIISADTATNDTHWLIGSGHHSILNLNNLGTSASTSATERKASMLWSAGYFENGAADKKGFRGAAIQQFTKDTGNSYWVWTLRSLAPWNAIQSQYELWQTGEAIAGVGVYRYTGDNHYVSASGGTTGATMPTHTSGTVSDGGVDWTYVDSADRSVIQIDQYNRVLLGVSSFDNTFTHKSRSDDPLGGAYSFHGKSSGVSKEAFFKLTPTDSGSAESAQPFIKAKHGEGLSIQKSDNSTYILQVDDANGLQLRKYRHFSGTAVNLDTTPSVLGDVTTLYLSNTGATSITALDDAVEGQIIRLIATNGNTTLVHSSTLMLAGSVNVTLTAWSSVTLERVPNSISARWVEVARSIK